MDRVKLLMSLAVGIALATSTVQAQTSSPMQHVVLRKFPFPYRAMLAIDSDADHVDLRKFNEVHEFLNTTSETPMGKGLGLDISDSFFLYNGSNLRREIDADGKTVAKDEMTLFQGVSHTPSVYAPILLHYIRHGWIDTFHGGGDFTQTDPNTTLFNRELVSYAFAWLQQQAVPPIISFTDHGNQSNVGNFGSYQPSGFDSYQQGDNPSSPDYITRTLENEGVKFVWTDHFQNKYSFDSMLYPVSLRDGTKMWGFDRYTGTRKLLSIEHWGSGTGQHRRRTKHQYTEALWHDQWTPGLLWQELTTDRLSFLVQTGGYTVLATHLEGNSDQFPLDTADIEALTRLAHMQDKGEILVADTPRLLWYDLVQSGLRFKVSTERQLASTVIDVTKIVDPVDGNFIPTWQDLRGVTWYVDDPENATVVINGQAVPTQDIVRSNGTIGIAWYPANTTDWTVNLNTPLYRALATRMLAAE